jgi:cytochrome b
MRQVQVRQVQLPMPIWDIPIRLFHWLLVVLVGFMWLSAEKGWMEYHMWAGYAVLSLLLFRLVWGFIGSDTARFAFFLKSPLAALRHLAHIAKREPDTEIGHNAAGGWMVLVLLGLLLAQVVTGLGANDDIAIEGPLAARLGKSLSDDFTRYHFLLFKVLQIVVLLHVVAIVAYAVLKRHDLVRPMITGKKRLPGAMRAPRMMSPVLALIVYMVIVALLYAVWRWAL